MVKNFDRQTKKRFKLKIGPDYIQTPIKISLVLSVVILLLVVVSINLIQPVIPLFYSLPDAQQQLVSRNWLLLLPALSILFNTIHIGGIRLFSQMDQLMIKLYAWAAVVIQSTLLMIALRNILIVLKI